MRILRAIVLTVATLATAASLAGCYGYVGPPTCVRVWVPPHYAGYGYWVHGHWRCA